MNDSLPGAIDLGAAPGRGLEDLGKENTCQVELRCANAAGLGKVCTNPRGCDKSMYDRYGRPTNPSRMGNGHDVDAKLQSEIPTTGKSGSTLTKPR
jgi:hypothetical protein